MLGIFIAISDPLHNFAWGSLSSLKSPPGSIFCLFSTPSASFSFYRQELELDKSIDEVAAGFLVFTWLGADLSLAPTRTPKPLPTKIRALAAFNTTRTKRQQHTCRQHHRDCLSFFGSRDLVVTSLWTQRRLKSTLHLLSSTDQFHFNPFTGCDFLHIK